jgi:hypothetical protein
MKLNRLRSSGEGWRWGTWLIMIDDMAEQAYEHSLGGLGGC